MNWDSALIGVVVGSILSLIGNFTNHWFSMRKEEKQWERQQEVEDKKRNFEERKQRIENVRNIYHNCISHLSLIEASRSENLKISDEKMIVINQESFKWLSLLSLHQRDLYDENNNFHQQFKNFTGNPILYVPIMLKEVYKLAMSDQVLFPHAKQKERNPNLKRFYMEIDKVFMRQKMIEGINLFPSYTLDVDITKIKPSQRQKIWDQNKNNIPDTIYLKTPLINKDNRINLNVQGIWPARVNPLETSVEEIFDKWEKDYDNALKLA